MATDRVRNRPVFVFDFDVAGKQSQFAGFWPEIRKSKNEMRNNIKCAKTKFSKQMQNISRLHGKRF